MNNYKFRGKAHKSEDGKSLICSDCGRRYMRLDNKEIVKIEWS